MPKGIRKNSGYNGTPEERFWKYVNRGTEDECWEWTGMRQNKKSRYGSIRVGNKLVRAHRLSYEINVGRIPKNMDILHRCDNPPCVNPNHLFHGTHTENMRDMVKKKRNPRRYGENNVMAKINKEDVQKIKNMYKVYKVTQKEIGKKFGLCQQSICNIINNKTWKHE